jgi:hypothetical protein
VDHTERWERRRIQQREELARDEMRFGDFWYDAKHNPYLTMVAGVVIGTPSLGASFVMATSGGFGPLAPLAPLVPTAAVTWRMLRQFRRWGRPKDASRKPNKERELLLAVLDAGGSTTPVEAALDTSLTVDEAEEVLSRLAERGHLRVESRDGALFYVMPTASPGRLESSPGTAF